MLKADNVSLTPPLLCARTTSLEVTVMKPTLIESQVEFRSLDEATLLKALANPDKTNSLTKEIARLIIGYVTNPSAVPRWPIEVLAVRLKTNARADSLKRPGLSVKPTAIIRRAVKTHRLSTSCAKSPISKQA